MQPWVHILACPACPFATLVVNSLNEHIAGCHGGQGVSYTLFVCPVCDACSTDGRLIDEHLVVYHSSNQDDSADDDEIVSEVPDHLSQLVQARAAAEAAGASHRKYRRLPAAAASAAHAAASAAVVEAHACRSCRMVFASRKQLRLHNCGDGSLQLRADDGQLNDDEAEEEADPLMQRLFDIWAATEAGAAVDADVDHSDGAAEEAEDPAVHNRNDTHDNDGGADADLSEEPQQTQRLCPATLRCPACPQRFRLLHTLSDHQLGKHDACRCPVPACDAVAFSVSAALRHVAEEHPDAALFKCPRCPAQYGSREPLASHWLAEHSHKVFPCPFCNRAFLQERYRTRHVRLLHPAQVASLQPCPQCRQVLPSAEELCRHLRDVHSAADEGRRLRCGVCGRTFGLARSLEVHELSHRTHPAPFACSLCPYACNTRYLLQCHVRDKHTGFTYNCALCPARLQSRYLLRKHLNVTHGLADARAAVRAAASLKQQRRQHQNIMLPLRRV